MAPRELPPAYPRLPTNVEAAGGPVIVKLRTAKVMAEDKEVWGSWDESSRTIELDARVHPRHQWRVFFHELMHATLADAGLENLFPEPTVEALCDAVATARMREKFG